MGKSTAIVEVVMWSLVVAIATLSGCRSSDSNALTVLCYESPRYHGFGWSAVVLRDGSVMHQLGAASIEWYQIPPETAEHLFRFAESIVTRRHSMTAVVGSYPGTITLFSGPEMRGAASWDEEIRPFYGFTDSHELSDDQHVVHQFVMDWIQLKMALASALDSRNRMDRPRRLGSASEQVVDDKAARWEANRAWWGELIERGRYRR